MAKYGFRRLTTGSRELVELADWKPPHDADIRPCHWTEAHQWVRDGGLHATGLWRDWEDRIRYAKGEGA